jgi:4-amino-4-deoxy-L-arabinose transferase-like glycosyltransferase
MSIGTQWEKSLKGWMLALPLVLTAVVYLASASNRAVIDYDEGYYAQAAKNMADSGNWVTPYANGVKFLEKPPFMYWLTAASFRTFGIGEFALRLPSALGVIALVWVTILIAWRGAGTRAAVVAGLCTAFSAGTYLFTREALHDIWLVLFITLGMYAFFEWHLDVRHSLRHALLFYASLAGAIMCKGMAGIVLPAGIITLFFLFSRELPRRSTLYLLPGSALFLVLAVPWHWAAAIQNKGFLHYYFVNEQFLRYFGKHDPPVLWNVPLLAFWALILVWFFPWTAFLPAAFVACVNPADRNRRVLVKLALAWAIAILAFFSISARLEHYAFPALPALALLVGIALGESEDNRAVKWAFRGLAVLGGVCFAFSVGAALWFVASGHSLDIVAPAGSKSRVYETDFSILSAMPAAMISNLIKPAAATILSMAVGFMAALWFESRHRRIQAVFCLAAVMAVICGMAHWSLIICEDLISSKKFALAVAREAHPGDRMVVMGDYESANSLNFYQPLPVEIVGGVAYALIPGMKFPNAPKVLLKQDEFESIWKSDNRVFVLLPKSRLSELRPGGFSMLEVLDRVLIRNHREIGVGP